MKIRDIAFAFVPYNMRNGHRAPAIMVNANDYAAARKEAKSRSTLVQRFPNVWSID